MAGPIAPSTSSTTARWAALAGAASTIAAIVDKIARISVAARNRIMTIQGPEPGWRRAHGRLPNDALSSHYSWPDRQRPHRDVFAAGGRRSELQARRVS